MIGDRIKKIHDCSNCGFSKEVAPNKVILQCEIDMKMQLQPHTCSRWASRLFKIIRKEVTNG